MPILEHLAVAAVDLVQLAADQAALVVLQVLVTSTLVLDLVDALVDLHTTLLTQVE